jgi:hypothetical protein
MKKIIGFTILILFCLTLQAKKTIFLKLDKVIRTPVTKELKPEDSKKFSDEYLAIVWETTPLGFEFKLTNPGESALTILWDECSFVNEDKKSSKLVFRETVRQTDVPPASQYEGMVAPGDYIFWSGKNWTLNPIFQEKLNDQQFAQIADKDLIYKVNLAFKRGGKKTNYSFTFKAFVR